jgi:hypothetical protein
MTPKERKIDDWALKAAHAIDKQWRACDEETGRECRGIRCWMGEHRAQAYLYRIMEEVSQ